VFDFSSLHDEQYHTSAGGQSVSVQFCPKGVLPAGRVLEEAGDGVTLTYATTKSCGSGKETNVVNLVCPTNGAGDEGGVRLTFEQTADCTNFFRAETTLACPAVGGSSTTALSLFGVILSTCYGSSDASFPAAFQCHATYVPCACSACSAGSACAVLFCARFPMSSLGWCCIYRLVLPLP
jgi:hypothetical protein